MNINYVRKQIKNAMNLMQNMDITNDFKSFQSRINNQQKINEAYSILFDLDKLLKMEESND